jgi:hypothetical protein
VAGRFRILADEHWSAAHVKAIRSAGWELARLVDVAELGQGTPDPNILAYCTEHGYVWMTADQRAQGHITRWIEAGRAFPGALIAVQRHRISPGHLLRFLEGLADEETPFAQVIRFVPAE